MIMQGSFAALGPGTQRWRRSVPVGSQLTRRGVHTLKKLISRRRFLQNAAMAGAAFPLILPGLSYAKPANSRLQHAAIGVGGQGESDLSSIVSSGKVDVVALCDIDEVNLKKAAKTYPNAKLYRDWREMLDSEGRRIDALNIATPDHMHAPAAMSAIRKGIHVYCEKPLTHEVYEARQLTLAARKKGVATQMGIQIHAHEYYRTAVHYLQAGAIGKVKEWHSWCNSKFTTDDKKRPEGADPVPSSVNWDLWLGVAPERPYKQGIYHPFNWRCWRDFGGGATGDFGCHIFDPVFTALGIGAPISLSCEAESVSDEVHPGWTIAKYLFPGTPLTAGNTIEATWRDGGLLPPVEFSPHLEKDHDLPPSGSMLIGEEGTLIIPHVGPPQLHPRPKFADYPKPTLAPMDHYHEFVEGALGNGTPGANFDFSGPLAETVLLATIANRYPGKTFEWNAEKMTFTNFPEADQFLQRKYRDGWRVRGL